MHTGRRWYLVAWDVERADWRTFRVDRIEAGLVAAGPFVARTPPAEDLVAYVSNAVSAAPTAPGPSGPARAAGRGRVRVPPTVGTLEAIDDASCLLRTGSDWLGGLAVYVAEIGVDFTVLEPPEFADRVRGSGRFARATRPQPAPRP